MEERANEATRNRPEGDRLIDAPMVEIDLHRFINQLKSEEAWRDSQRNAITVFKTDSMRLVLIGLHMGGELPEHTAEGVISVHVLKGHILFRANNEEKKLTEGHIITLHENIPHSIIAVEESIFLLTIALRK